MPDHVRQITIMRGGAIGDFVLTVPAIEALREYYPRASLRIIGSPTIASLAHPDGILSQDSACLTPLFMTAYPLPVGTRNLFAGVDLFLAYAVDPEGILDANLRKLVEGKLIVHDPRPIAGSCCHISDHLLAPVGKLGIPIGNRTPCLLLRKSDRDFGHRFLVRHQLSPPTVVIHPGSGGRHKCWPIQHYMSLVKALHEKGICTILLLGEAENDMASYLRGRPAQCVTLRSPNLHDLAGLLACADLFIGNDSGPGHIAAAVGTPTIILFGPTDPRIWGPRHPKSSIIIAPNHELAALDVHQVAEAALEGLSKFCPFMADSFPT